MGNTCKNGSQGKIWVKTTIKAGRRLNTNPRSGQYLTRAHSHITQALAAVDSFFGIDRLHQHGLAVGQQ